MGKDGYPPITLRYNGLFDFDGMYAALIDWAKNYGYKWHEAEYKHKVPSPAGAEKEFKWVITKNVTRFVSYKITFEVHVWDLREVVVEHKALYNGRISINIKGELSYDWQEQMGKGRLAKKFKLADLYRKITGEVDVVYNDQLYYRMWNVHAMLKEFFNMQTKKHAYKHKQGEN